MLYWKTSFYCWFCAENKVVRETRVIYLQRVSVVQSPVFDSALIKRAIPPNTSRSVHALNRTLVPPSMLVPVTLVPEQPQDWGKTWNLVDIEITNSALWLSVGWEWILGRFQSHHAGSSSPRLKQKASCTGHATLRFECKKVNGWIAKPKYLAIPHPAQPPAVFDEIHSG